MFDTPGAQPSSAKLDESQPNEAARQVLEVARPQPGELRIVDLDRSTEVVFAFNLEEARIIALDVDIIIAFSDGGKLLLPNLGLLATGSQPPAVRFSGRAFNWEQVLSTVTDVTIGESTATLSNIDRTSSTAGRAADPSDSRPDPVAETPPVMPAPLIRAQSLRNADADAQNANVSEPLSIKSQPLEIPKPLVLSSGSATRFSDPSQNAGYYLTSGLTVALSAGLYNNPTATPHVQNADGSHTVYFAPGGYGSDTDAGYLAQSTARLQPVAATNHGDSIYLDDPTKIPQGYAYRKLVLTLDSQTQGFEVLSVAVSGLPAGAKILGYTAVNGAYQIPVNEDADGKLELDLIYALPGADVVKDADGFYERFQLTVRSTAGNVQGDFRETSGVIRFGVRDVASEVDTQFADAKGSVKVLWANPPGGVAVGGDGADTFYSGAGADTITGGGGTDLVSYRYSNHAVTVDLQSRTHGANLVSDAFLDDIENVEGSTYADSLAGNSKDNVFITCGGADTIDGRSGSDTVDFSSSAEGVTVDLNSAGAQTGGLAAGVVLSNIENIVGSKTGENYFVGSDADNRFVGGDVNDTFVGSLGHDSYIGGGGYNVVDYSGVTSGLSLDMQASTVLFQNIGKIIGSAFGDTISGDSASNFIVGGGGGDSLVGRGGNDTLDGGEGADTFRDDGGVDSYSGGAGDDLFIGSASFVPGLQFDGGDGFDVVDYSEFAPATQQSLIVTMFPDGSGRSDWPGNPLIGNFVNMEGVIGSRYAENSISGNDSDNLLVGGDLSDTIIGKGGRDTISGAGGGGDCLIGGGDGDTLDYSRANVGVTVTVSGSIYTAQIGNSFDTLSGFQDIIGSSHDDRIYGDEQARAILAGAGDDTISPGLGDDTIDGGGGVDLVDLGYLGAAGLSIDLRTPGAPVLGNGQSLFLSNIEGVIGTAGADTIFANPAHPGYIASGAGDDSIVAGGSVGGETLDGGAGVDIADYSAETLALSVNLADGVLRSFAIGGQTGLAGNIEILIGGAGADTIAAIGDDVAHTFVGNLGDDSLAGGAFNDSLSGGQGNDIVAGGLGDDVLDGGDGADSLAGGSGDDTLLGGLGDDSFDGGAGAADLLSYAGRAVGISVSFTAATTATITVSATERDTLVNVENIDGGLGGDTISALGDTVAHRFYGDLGDDCLVGGSGADTLGGGLGADSIFGAGRGNAGDAGDVLDYSYTNGLSTSVTGLTYDMASAAAALNGVSVTVGAGDVDLLGYFQSIVGSSGNDRIVTDANSNTLSLGAGDDTIVGANAGDLFDGGSGSDWLDLSGTAQNISARLGEPSATATIVAGGASGAVFSNFEALIGGAGADTLGGNSGANTLVGGAGADSLNSGGGNDSLSAGSGNNTIDGGAGVDALTYADATAGVTLTLSSSVAATATIGAQRDLVSNVEIVLGSAFNDAIVGSALSETLSGGLGADTLTGGGGSNSLSGGAGDDRFYLDQGVGGADTIDGGDGTDTLDLSRFTTGVSVKLNGGGFGFAVVGGRTITLINIENVIGGSGNDTLTGDEGANFLDGGSGDNSLSGGLGDDTLFAGAGNDTLRGGPGTNLLDPGTGADSITNDDLSAGLSQVILPATPNYSGTDYGDTLVGGTNAQGLTAAYTFSGEGGDDSLVGGSMNDYLLGGEGDDTIFGLGGQDTLVGGVGNDKMDGGQGSLDYADYASRTVGISVTYDDFVTSTVYVDPTTGERDTIVNLEWIAGGSGNDTIAATDASAHGFIGNAGDDCLIGGSGNDTLSGGAGADTVFGGLGNDRIYAGGGGETLDGGGGSNLLDLSNLTDAFVTVGVDGHTIVTTTGAGGSDAVNFEQIAGGAGNDTIIGSAGAFTVDGGAGADCLVGGASDDSLSGGSGNDTFVSGGGNDTLDGGSGAADVVDYSGLTGGLSVSLAAGAGVTTVTLAAGEFDTLVNIENLIATAFDDTIAAAAGDTVPRFFSGLAGNDSLVGGTASDTLDGGAGNDTLVGLTGANSLFGDSGQDSITGNSGAETLDGGAGADTMAGGAGNDYYIADSTDSISEAAGGGTDTVGTRDTFFNLGSALISVNQIENLEFIGNAGDAFTGIGNSVANRITGGGGADSLSGGGGSDTLLGGAGNDTLDGGTEADSLLGGDGGDSLFGGISTHADTLLGGAGNDTIAPDGGADSVDGGDGFDTVDYTTRGFGITATVGAPTYVVNVSGLNQTLVNIEVFIGSAGTDSLTGGATNDTIDGGFGNDFVNGGAGDDSLGGGGGNDVVTAGLGNDTLDGGTGTDTLDYSYLASSDAMSVAAMDANGWTTVYLPSGERDIIRNFEIVNGGAGNDTLVASPSLYMSGGAGDDSFVGASSGAGSLSGGAGNDTFYDSLGSDTLDGGTGVDWLLLADRTTGINGSVNGGTATNVTIGAEVNRVSNIENVVLGSGADFFAGVDAGAHLFFGNAGNDTLSTAGGDDTLDGGSGSDSLVGGAGNDLYVVDSYGDTLSDSSGVDTVQTSVMPSLNLNFLSGGAAIENITDLGTGDFTAVGNALANVIIGGAGANSLFGGDGADTVTGAAGADTLAGGNGADSLSGGLGNDMLIGDTYGSDTLDGGAGDDTLVGGVDGAGYYTKLSGFTNTAITGGAVSLGANAALTIRFSAAFVDTTVINGSNQAVATVFMGGKYFSFGMVDARTLGLVSGNNSGGTTGPVGLNAATYTADNQFHTIAFRFQNDDAANTMTVTAYRDGAFAFARVYSMDPNTVLTTASGTTISGYLGGGLGSALTGLTLGARSGFGNKFDNLSIWQDALTNDALSAASAGLTPTGAPGSLIGDYGFDGGGTSTPNLSGSSVLGATTLSGTGSLTAYNSPGDTLTGGAGADSLIGSAVDTMRGGDGFDTISGGVADYAYAATAVSLNLALGTASVSTTDVDTLVNVRSAYGTALADTMIGDANSNMFQGSLGNDSLDGGAGSDTVDYSYVAAGTNLSINLSLATATVVGGAGDTDVIRNFENAIGGSGDDTIIAGSASASLVGGAGNDVLTGGAGADSLYGGTGDDCLFGQGGNDYFVGGVGNDTLDGGAGVDTVDYSGRTVGVTLRLDGANWATAAVGVGETDWLRNVEYVVGSSANDCFIGDAANNSISGGAGADTFIASLGNDTYDGGGQSGDRLDYSGVDLGVGITAALNGATATTVSFAGAGKTDVFPQMSNLIGTKYADYLTGDGNANYISAGAGDDTIIPGLGADTIDGGDGIDTLFIAHFSYSSAVSISLDASGSGLGSNAGAAFQVYNMENLIGRYGADTLIGNDSSNTILGNQNADSLDGGGGVDTVDYSYASVALSIALAGSTRITVTGETALGDIDTIVNFENVIGGAGADTIVGDTLDNILRGGAGNDRLDGGAGNDTVDYAYATTGVTISLDVAGGASVSVAASDRDTLFNFENVIGGSGADNLSGNSFANFLQGGLGNDTLFGGGAGADTLWGGTGNDMIQFGRTDFAGMKIDGGAGTDTIQFQASGSYNGADLSVAITNVEVLDFRKAGADVSIALSGAEIAKLAGLNGSSRDLTILTSAGGGDAVSITDTAANIVSAANGATTDYTIYDRDANDPTKTVLAILHVTPA